MHCAGKERAGAAEAEETFGPCLGLVLLVSAVPNWCLIFAPAFEGVKAMFPGGVRGSGSALPGAFFGSHGKRRSFELLEIYRGNSLATQVANY